MYYIASYTISIYYFNASFPLPFIAFRMAGLGVSTVTALVQSSANTWACVQRRLAADICKTIVSR